MSIFMPTITFRKKTVLLAGLGFMAAVAVTSVQAKLPVPAVTPESTAKAEEAKVKAADAAKLANDQLATSQDKVAAHWGAKARAQGKEFKPTPIAAPATAPAPVAAAAPAAIAPPKK